MKQVEPLESPEEFVDWVEDQIDSDPLLQELHEFHGYIREDGLDPGTRLGYRKKIRDELNADGYLEEYDEALSESADSALKKYREFLEGSDNADESTNEVDE